MESVPAPFWVLLAPRARKWGLVSLALGRPVLSLLTLPLTVVQLQALFEELSGRDRRRLDYLVMPSATISWL